jgi:hypothetical protein
VAVTDRHRAYFERNAVVREFKLPEIKAAERFAKDQQAGLIRGMVSETKQWVIVEVLKWVLLIAIVYLLFSL